MAKSALILAYAVTPVHPGAGRAPSAVDLPVQRDSLGYPVVYGSSFKGVLKSHLMHNSQSGANLAKCLFGSEVSDPDKEMGRLIVTDLIPALYPVPSLEYGYVYVTSEYLVSRVIDLLDALGGPDEIKGALAPQGAPNQAQGQATGVGGKQVTLLLTKSSPKRVIQLHKEIKALGALIRARDEAYVYEDPEALAIIDSALLRVARNQLDDQTKTSKNLWYEEYLPQGTVFFGAVFDGERKNNLCKSKDQSVDYIQEFSRAFDGKSVIIGGKETVGKGLIKLRVVVGDRKPSP